MRNKILTSFGNLPTFSGQKGREFLLNQLITGYNIRGQSPLFIQAWIIGTPAQAWSPSRKKPTTPNSDQKRIQTHIRIRSKSSCCRQPKGIVDSYLTNPTFGKRCRQHKVPAVNSQFQQLSVSESECRQPKGTVDSPMPCPLKTPYFNFLFFSLPTGTNIFSALAKMEALHNLSVSDNRFTGNLSLEVGSISSLGFLDRSCNSFYDHTQ